MNNELKNTYLRFKKYFLFIFLMFSSLTSHSETIVKCEQLFFSGSKKNQNQTVPQENKYKILADELGLTYLKAPVPAGYRREIINSRTYIKKDGTTGKTLRFYRYRRPDGSIIRPILNSAEYKSIIEKFKQFEIEPTWQNVWLSTDSTTHIQVLAKDHKGETATIYHEDWGTGASQAKYVRVQSLGPKVSLIRKKLDSVLKNTDIKIDEKSKVDAVALKLLMSGRIRVGDIKYQNENGTTGVTTLLKNQVEINEKNQLFLIYIGKSGNKNPENPTFTQIEITDKLLKTAIIELKNTNTHDPRLLIYKSNTAHDELSALTPSGVNNEFRNLLLKYKKHSEKNQMFTVKDLRTWSATVKTVEELIRAGRPPTELDKKSKVLQVVAKNVSRLLNNTPGVARENYIDPRLLNPDGYEKLWTLCEDQFPDLIKSNALPTNLTDKNDFNLQFDLKFEPLVLQFLTTYSDF